MHDHADQSYHDVMDPLYAHMENAKMPGHLTKKQVRAALVAICSDPDNAEYILECLPDFVDELPEDVDKGNAIIAERFVDEVFSDKIVDYVNANMSEHFIVETRYDDMEDVVSFVRAMSRKTVDDLPYDAWLTMSDVFPMVANMPACLVGSCGGSGGGIGHIGYSDGEETYIANDGSVWTAWVYDFWDGSNATDPLLTIRVPTRLGNGHVACPSLDQISDMFPKGFDDIVTHD